MDNFSLRSLRYLPIVLVSTYILFISLVLHPQIQAHNVFLHSINYPFLLDLSRPDKIKSLPSGRVRNFRTVTADGVIICGWHLLPDGFESRALSPESFDRALSQRPILIYFHGNAMNRAAPFRIQAYKQFVALDINVVAIDYRGFGDSRGSPSEQGLQRDARAVYKWIKEKQKSSVGNSQLPIFVVGQSLGTGVAARLALDLVKIGHPANALFLIAPFTSIRQLLTSYKIGGLIPIFWPLGIWKSLGDLADRHLHTRFESDKAVFQIVKAGNLSLQEKEKYESLDYILSDSDLYQELGLSASASAEVKTNIIISHADDDRVIPHAHGQSLLDTIAEALNQKDFTERDFSWGKTFTLNTEDGASYTLVKSVRGGHNGVPAHAVKLFGELNNLQQIVADD